MTDEKLDGMLPTETRAGEPPNNKPDIINNDSKTTIITPGEADDHDSHAKEDGFLHGFKLYLVVLGLCLTVLLLGLDTSILATAIPTITSEMHSTADIGWYGNTFLLTACSLQPLSGKIYSQFPIKYAFLVFVAIFELGSLVCATAPSSNALIVGRAIAGAGSSGLYSGSITILSIATSLEKRAVLMGIMSSMMGVATITGPLLGGALTQHASWRWCFYINLPCGFVTAVLLATLQLPKRDLAPTTLLQKLAKLDILGCALFIPTCVMFLLALQWGGTTYAWDSATILGLFIGCIPLLCLFIFWQRHRGIDAMIPLPVLAQRTVAASCLALLFQMGGLMLVSYYLPTWFQVVKGASPTMSGVMGLPTILSQVLAAVISGILVGKIGYCVPFMLVGAMLATIGYGLMSTFTLSTSTGAWIGYLITAGLGRGMALQMPLLAIQSVLPLAQIPTGNSMATFCQFFGGTLFISFGETAFTNRLRPSLQKFAPDVDEETVIHAGAAVAKTMGKGVARAYNQALVQTFYVAVGAGCAAFVMSLLLEWRHIKQQQGVDEKLSDEEKA